MAPDGSPWLIELEAVEPCLFLPLAPHAAPAYAAAIADWLG
jgi:hypothetical protein